MNLCRLKSSLVFALICLLLPDATWARSEPIPLYMDAMLHAGRTVYDRQSPPTQEKEQATKVKLAMYIEGMSSFRTQTMDFQLDVYFQQFWKDPRLAHNETRRVLVRDRKLLDRMWHPDVYFANARVAEFHQITQPNFLVWIEPDGSILYDTRISMTVVCTLNLEKWPLDSQRCNLRILSYAYNTDELEIEWTEVEPITRNPNIAMSDMHIVDLFPGSCDGNYTTGMWSCVTAEFFVKREITHHVMQSYVPTTLIVVISWFSFWLDVEAVPARVSLAITTLLTLSTQANAARMALPEVSYMKAIDVWMGACMMFVFGVMIEFTIVNYAQRQGRKWHRSDADIVMASSLESVDKKESVHNRARELLDRLKGGNKEHQHLVEDEVEHIRLTVVDDDDDDEDDVDDDYEEEGALQPMGADPQADSPKTIHTAEMWKEKEAEKAERLANWAVFDDDQQTPPPTAPLKRRGSNSVWAKLTPNGTCETKTAPNYGSTEPPEKPAGKKNGGVGGGDKWTSAIKQIQKNKRASFPPEDNPRDTHRRSMFHRLTGDFLAITKIAGRNRAKRIDQKSRWVFPATFVIFNIFYWGYYLFID